MSNTQPYQPYHNKWLVTIAAIVSIAAFASAALHYQAPTPVIVIVTIALAGLGGFLMHRALNGNNGGGTKSSGG